eukprot:CAMPEP_0184740210 /NCGR_PEP_ID=MMETSP0315-20130426/3223_1 /TAXON_ID=101924 /ORGANISM="Rhodosorus marinus, Strain UTEX LB 2760" /LENGTH=127 /DNA_ID=CAMNT_0027209737 /DNA_START=214 /DNA_END=597 /DNA_ORIENTATION=+
MSWTWRYFKLLSSGRRSFSVLKDDEVSRVWAALANALEGVSRIEESATTAYLEMDPTERAHRNDLVLRYQQFALQDLETALSRYRALDSASLSSCEEDMRNRIKLSAADSMLAMDKITAAIERSAEK